MKRTLSYVGLERSAVFFPDRPVLLFFELPDFGHRPLVHRFDGPEPVDHRPDFLNDGLPSSLPPVFEMLKGYSVFEFENRLPSEPCIQIKHITAIALGMNPNRANTGHYTSEVSGCPSEAVRQIFPDRLK